MSHAKRAKRLVRRTTKKLRRSASSVRLRNRLRKLPQFRPGTPPHVDVLLNFPDGPRNLYQVQQWYGPLEHLNRFFTVAILCYHPETAQRVAEETDLKVVLTPSFTDLSEVRDSLTPKVILYPNQNFTNYKILGLDQAQHVFICHGESDKIYMASNWVKVFNYFFIAGQASHDRLEKYVRNYDVEQRTIRIGRPQVDIPSTPQIEKADGRITVLYAPTWEGGRATMRYGSVESHGLSIIESLVADDRFQIIYRPHPRTGIHLEEVKQADEAIRLKLFEESMRNPEAGHTVDEDPFSWQLEYADVMITDVSAVAYDWLTTAKPLLITRPVETQAIMPQSGYIARAPLLDSADASAVNSRLAAMIDDPVIYAAQAEWADYYYGDRAPGASLQRFVTAIQHVLNEQFHARHSAATRGPSPGLSSASPATTEAVESARGNSQHESLSVRSSAEHKIQRLARGASHALEAVFWAERARKLVEDTFENLDYGRTSPIVVTAMGDVDSLEDLVSWIPALEAVDQAKGVSIVVGTLRSYSHLKRRTGLRIFIGNDATSTETIYRRLAPEMSLHFDQANLNLRETTHRNMAHVYVGSARHRAWVNNRLRLFDVIITPPGVSSQLIPEELIRFPSTISIVSADGGGADSSRNRRDVLMNVLNDLPMDDSGQER